MKWYGCRQYRIGNFRIILAIDFRESIILLCVIAWNVLEWLKRDARNLLRSWSAWRCHPMAVYSISKQQPSHWRWSQSAYAKKWTIYQAHDGQSINAKNQIKSYALLFKAEFISRSTECKWWVSLNELRGIVFRLFVGNIKRFIYLSHVVLNAGRPVFHISDFLSRKENRRFAQFISMYLRRNGMLYWPSERC